MQEPKNMSVYHFQLVGTTYEFVAKTEDEAKELMRAELIKLAQAGELDFELEGVSQVPTSESLPIRAEAVLMEVKDGVPHRYSIQVNGKPIGSVFVEDTPSTLGSRYYRAKIKDVTESEEKAWGLDRGTLQEAADDLLDAHFGR